MPFTKPAIYANIICLFTLSKKYMESKRGNVSILYPSCKCQVNDLYITCEFAERLLGSTAQGFPLLYIPSQGRSVHYTGYFRVQ